MRSELAPGYAHKATAKRTGMTGSLSFGIRQYDKTPIAMVAKRSTHDT